MTLKTAAKNGKVFSLCTMLLVTLYLFPAWSPAQGLQATNPSGRVPDETFARILSRIQAQLERARTSLKFPGATVGFALPDGRSASASAGVADLKTKTLLKTSDRLLAG